MADTTAFDSLVAKLPPDHQTCFIAVSARLQALPPDHELALALEVLGFAALVLKEIPREVSEVIDRFRLDLSDRPQEEIEAVLAHWLEESCYRRLRETLRLVKESHRQFQPKSERTKEFILNTRHWLEGQHTMPRKAVITIFAGALCGAILLGVGVLAAPGKASAIAVRSLPVEQGIINYHEANIPDLGGKVGMVLVGGEVLGAFKEENLGVVVIKPLVKP